MHRFAIIDTPLNRARLALHGMARAVPVELPPAVDQRPVSEPLDWHPDHEDHSTMIAAFALDPRMPVPYAAFAQ